MRMEKIDVIIIVEHINRELESAIIIKEMLTRRGLKTRISSAFFDYGTDLLKYETKLIVTPWCYDNHEMNLIKKFKGDARGFLRILNLHQEQVAFEAATKFVLPKDTAKEIYHISWGEHYKEQLISIGVKDFQIRTVGSTRLQLFDRELSNLLSYKKTELATFHGLNHKKYWILIVGNFSYGFFDDNKIKQLQARGIVSADLIRDISRQSYYELLNWYDFLLSKNRDEYELIYRPHPNEPITEELLLLDRKHQSFHIIRDNSIRDWQQRSDLVFLWNSTSCVESIAARKPTYALNPFDQIPSFKVDVVDKIPKINSLAEFSIIIDNHLKRELEYDFENILRTHSRYYSSNINSFKQTVIFIEEILRSDYFVVNSLHNEQKAKILILFLKQKLKNLFFKVGILRFIKKYRLQIADFFKDDQNIDKNGFYDRVRRNNYEVIDTIEKYK